MGEEGREPAGSTTAVPSLPSSPASLQDLDGNPEPPRPGGEPHGLAWPVLAAAPPLASLLSSSSSWREGLWRPAWGEAGKMAPGSTTTSAPGRRRPQACIWPPAAPLPTHYDGASFPVERRAQTLRSLQPPRRPRGTRIHRRQPLGLIAEGLAPRRPWATRKQRWRRCW